MVWNVVRVSGQHTAPLVVDNGNTANTAIYEVFVASQATRWQPHLSIRRIQETNRRNEFEILR